MTQGTTNGITRDISMALRHRIVPANAARHGLVIGVEAYRDARLNLRCARADAMAMYELMVDPAVGMFPTGNVELLVDEKATKDAVWRALVRLSRSSSERDTVWIFYAGHAAPDGLDTYWVTHDAEIDDLLGTALASSEIHRVLGMIRSARLVTFLDCCHAAATSLQRHPTRDVGATRKTLEAFGGHGRITFSSSDGHEKSVELPELGHGAFTYFLSRGLRGEADAAGDGVVTAEKLWTFLRGKVTDASRKVGKPQTPILGGEMSHDMPLTLNPTAAAAHQKFAAAIQGLIGLGPDRLRTDEAEFCLDLLLRQCNKTEEQRNVLGALELAVNGSFNISHLRMLLSAVRPAAQDGASQPGMYRPIEAEAAEDRRALEAIAAANAQYERPGPVPGTSGIRPARGRRLTHKAVAPIVSATLIVGGGAFAWKINPFGSLFGQSRIGSASRPLELTEFTRSIGMHFVEISPGVYQMGSATSEEGRFDNEGLHSVQLTKPFLIATTPVTQLQYRVITGTNPSKFRADDLPVENVAWIDALAFCQKLSEKEQKRYRLPTEAEWEYACRAGTTTAFYSGDTEVELSAAGRYSGNSGGQTHPVGQKKPNAWGLFDMHGNVMQWCSDLYSDYPATGETVYREVRFMGRPAHCPRRVVVQRLHVLPFGVPHQSRPHKSQRKRRIPGLPRPVISNPWNRFSISNLLPTPNHRLQRERSARSISLRRPAPPTAPNDRCTEMAACESSSTWSLWGLLGQSVSSAMSSASHGAAAGKKIVPAAMRISAISLSRLLAAAGQDRLDRHSPAFDRLHDPLPDAVLLHAEPIEIPLADDVHRGLDHIGRLELETEVSQLDHLAHRRDVPHPDDGVARAIRIGVARRRRSARWIHHAKTRAG